MKKSILDQFAADAINAPAFVTGGCGKNDGKDGGKSHKSKKTHKDKKDKGDKGDGGDGKGGGCKC